ncbi:sigma-70 family RNA polymerase sigma factor [Actinosynnema sp. NPDC020468]|uniref:RNA polymerase sigma factor n=1 Tax=Actinosynnema sp. NPDC020468 TaxID=3154488 RepID=UPI0033E40D08
MSDTWFAEFHRAHRVSFLKYLALRGLARHDAEDVVSEAFVVLYRAREAVRGARSPEAFAFKVLRDSLVDFRRKRARLPVPMAEEVEGWTAPDDVAGLVARLDFQRMLGRLTPRQAECLELSVLLEYDVGKIGRYLGISPSAVHSHLSDARRRLEELGEHGEEER